MDATGPQSPHVWDDALLANPHLAPDKSRRIRRMFNAIARTYDLNNRLHSLFLDQRWRREAVRRARLKPGDVVADVACGTGDLALAFAGAGAGLVIGVDFASSMIELARIKAAASAIGRRACRFVCGDALELPLADGCADVVSIAFGIRNVADPPSALREFRRVLRPGGRLIMLEFGLPDNRLLRWLYGLYFSRVMPFTASVVSGDRSGAYRYLPQSVKTFLTPDCIRSLLTSCGFRGITQRNLSLGICVLYTAEA